jgi:hypothetical protein
MKKFLILIVVLVVVAVAAAAGFYFYSQSQAQKVVDEYLNSMPGVKSVSHDGVSYSLIGQKLVIPNLKIEYEKPQPMNLETSSVEIDKPDLGVIEKMKTAPEGTPMESVAESVNITNMKITDQQVEVTLSDYTVVNPQLGSIAFLEEGKDITPEQAVKLAQVIAVDRAELNEMKIVEKASGKQVGVINSMLLENYNAGKLGKMVMKGFDIQPDDEGKVVINSITATNLDYSKAMGVLAKIAETGQPGAEMPDLGLSYDQIKVEGIDVTAKGNKNVKIASVTLENFKQVGSIPSSLTFGVTGISMAVSQLDDPKAQQTFKMLGYENVVMDMGFDYKWEAEAKSLTLKNLFLGGPEMGKLSLSLNLAGVDLAAIKNVNDLMGLMGTLVFNDAELSYTDASLMERGLKMVAAMQGTDPETMRQGLLQQLMGMQQMMLPTPEGKKMAETLAAFVKEPKSLLITAKPDAPVPAMMLVGQAQTQPAELAKSLNLTFSVNGGDAVAVVIPDMGSGMGPGMSPGTTPPSATAPPPTPMPAPTPAPVPSAPSSPAPAPTPTPGETQAKPAEPGGFSFGDMFKKAMPAPAQPDSGGEVKAQPLN